MRDAADPGHGAFDSQSEPRVHECAVLPEVQVPAVVLFRELELAKPAQELVVVILPLASANDLADKLANLSETIKVAREKRDPAKEEEKKKNPFKSVS